MAMRWIPKQFSFRYALGVLMVIQFTLGHLEHIHTCACSMRCLFRLRITCIW
jgi:hypothetical protein